MLALSFVMFVAFSFSLVAHAQFGGGGGSDGGSGGGGGFGGGGGSGSDFEDTDSTELMNPLKSDSLVGFLLDLIDIMILFAIPLIVLMIIYAGFLYVMARGNEEQVTRATRALTYAVIGGLLILGAKLLLEIIEGTVDQLVR